MSDDDQASASSKGTLADAVGVIRPSLESCVVPEADAHRIMAIAGELPGALATGFGFECHLGNQPSHSDFFVRVEASEVGRHVLAGTSGLGSLPARLTDEPAWGGVCEFARSWADPAVDRNANTANVWLEFDIQAGDDGVPTPSVFFSAHHGVPSRLRQDDTAPSAVDAYGWVIHEALPTVLGRALAPATEEMMISALDALPTGASVFQVGVMLSRPLDAVRLCIAELPPDGIADYVIALGWEGAGGELRSLVEELAGLVDDVVLAIDVTERLSGRIGLECYFADYRQPREEPRWRTLFDHFVERSLCRPEQREALLAYPGFTPRTQTNAAWPDHLAAAASLLGPRATSGMARVLHHVKVAHRPGNRVEAKAYLGATHHWLVDGRVP